MRLRGRRHSRRPRSFRLHISPANTCAGLGNHDVPTTLGDQASPRRTLRCRRAQPPSHARALGPDRAGHRRRHRRRHLRHHRPGRGEPRRPGDHAVLRPRCDLLHLLRPGLRRIRVDGAGLRQRLHLHLRDAGRTGGVVHRLDARPGIRRLRLGGRGELDGLFPQPVATLRHHPAKGTGQRTAGRAAAAHRLHRQPARRRHRAAADVAVLRRHPQVVGDEHGDGRAQDGPDPAGDLRRLEVREPRQLAPLHPRQRRPRQVRLGRRAAWRVDGLLRLHRLRSGIRRGRNRTGPSATCPSACSPRSPSAPCCTSRWPRS